MRWLAVALYVGGVTAFLVWTLDTYAAGAPALFYFLWLLSAVAFVGLLVSALSPRRSMIDIFYYFYMAYFLLPPAVMQIGADRFPWEVKHSLQHAEYGTILIALTMVAYEVGRALHRPRHPAVVGLATPVLSRPPLGIFVLVGAVAALAAIPTLGFNNLFMGSRRPLGLLAGNLDHELRLLDRQRRRDGGHGVGHRAHAGTRSPP